MMHGSYTQWRLVATPVVKRWDYKASGWKFESHPGPHSWVLLDRCFGSVRLYFGGLFGFVLFFGGDIHVRWLFSQPAFPASLCTSLLLARYPRPTLPDLLPSHSSLFWFRFSFLFGSSLCLCEAEKLEKGRGTCELATSWRSSDRLLLCSALVSWFAFVVVVVLLLLCHRFSAS